MAKPKEEKRAVPRVPWQLPASVSFPDASRAQVELKDISSRGLFFFTQAKVEESSKLEIVLMMPPELGVVGQQWVCCQATVVRVEEDKPQQKVGVAAVIDRCEALPQI
jgi:PilZ domain-containing protein